MSNWKRNIGSGLLGGVVGEALGDTYASELFSAVAVTVALILIMSYLKETK